MLDLSPEKVVVLLAIALVVLGLQRLPQAARTIGKVLGEFRRISANVQSEMRESLAEPRQVLDGVVRDMGLEDFKGVAGDFRSAVNPLSSGSLTGGLLSGSLLSPGVAPSAGGAAQPANPDLPLPPDDPTLN